MNYRFEQQQTQTGIGISFWESRGNILWHAPESWIKAGSKNCCKRVRLYQAVRTAQTSAEGNEVVDEARRKFRPDDLTQSTLYDFVQGTTNFGSPSKGKIGESTVDARLRDDHGFARKKGDKTVLLEQQFKTCAVCIESCPNPKSGPEKNEVLGCIYWAVYVRERKAAGAAVKQIIVQRPVALKLNKELVEPLTAKAARNFQVKETPIETNKAAGAPPDRVFLDVFKEKGFFWTKNP